MIMPYGGKAIENAITPQQNDADGENSTDHVQRSQAARKAVKPNTTMCRSTIKSNSAQSGPNQSQCHPKPSRRVVVFSIRASRRLKMVRRRAAKKDDENSRGLMRLVRRRGTHPITFGEKAVLCITASLVAE
jgi:hypothetical protein